jgi:general secretion pathway protein K
MIPALTAWARCCARPVRAHPRPSAPSQGAYSEGFALLAVLWTITAVTALTGAALAVAQLGSTTTRNRVLLARAAWAREACVEILQARFAQDPSIRRVDSVDLGRGTWCAASLEDPAVKLNINVADRAALVSVLQSVLRLPGAVDSLADALLDWRDPDSIPRPLGNESSANRNGPLADVAELRYVRGFTAPRVAALSSFLTTRGSGVINVNAAPREVIATLPGMTDEAVQRVMMQRERMPIQNADVLAGLLSPAARAALLASYPEFVRSAVFTAPQLIAYVVGGIRGARLVARVTITAVPVAGRLAVIRRETE